MEVKLEMTTPFAAIEFVASGKGMRGSAMKPANCCDIVALPHRVNFCKLAGLILEPKERTPFDLKLIVHPAAGWSSSQEGGEHFCCINLDNEDDDQASIGLRDYEWLMNRHALRFLNGANHPKPFHASFETRNLGHLEIELSWAMTTAPQNYFEEISPWLATDKVLKF